MMRIRMRKSKSDIRILQMRLRILQITASACILPEARSQRQVVFNDLKHIQFPIYRNRQPVLNDHNAMRLEFSQKISQDPDQPTKKCECGENHHSKASFSRVTR